MRSSIPCSTFPIELRNKIVDKLPPQESFKLLKANRSLRNLVLDKGPFGTWVDSMCFEELVFDEAPDDAPSDDFREIELIDNNSVMSDDRPSFIATIAKNGYAYHFDLQFDLYITSIWQKIKACKVFEWRRESLVSKSFTELDEATLGCFLETHKSLLEKLVFVKVLKIELISPTFLNAITPRFHFTVAKRATILTSFDTLDTKNTENIVHFIENNLRFCREISINALFDNLLDALKKTRVERIFISLDFDDKDVLLLNNFTTWTVRNGLPSQDQDCSLSLAIIFNSDLAIIDPFSRHPLLKYAPSFKTRAKMVLEMSKAKRSDPVQTFPVEQVDFLQCLQKRHCKDNLRFLMMRETDEPLEPGSAAVMYFFVKRLKSADHPLQEKCEDAAAVVSLDDSPVASRQTFGRKKCNAADWDGEKEEVMPKKKRRPTDSD